MDRDVMMKECEKNQVYYDVRLEIESACSDTCEAEEDCLGK